MRELPEELSDEPDVSEVVDDSDVELRSDVDEPEDGCGDPLLNVELREEELVFPELTLEELLSVELLLDDELLSSEDEELDETSSLDELQEEELTSSELQLLDELIGRSLLDEELEESGSRLLLDDDERSLLDDDELEGVVVELDELLGGGSTPLEELELSGGTVSDDEEDELFQEESLENDDELTLGEEELCPDSDEYDEPLKLDDGSSAIGSSMLPGGGELALPEEDSAIR